MKLLRTPVISVMWIALVLPACAPKPEPVLEQATVVARNSSVRQRNSSTSRTLVTLNAGDKVDILQRQDNWYRIRHGENTQGWMEESTLVTVETLARIKQIADAATGQSTQNTAVTREDVNLRIEPGRSTAVIRKLDAGTKVEVLERTTNPRPGTEGGIDAWLKVRLSPGEVGWVIESLLDFSVPEELAPYTESYTYTAIRPLKTVEDPVAGPVRWYVVGERGPGTDPAIDFDGIRVFTWNLKMHHYETAYRAREIRGVYPLESGEANGNPTFRYHQLTGEPAARTAVDFVMNGVVTRPLIRPEKAVVRSPR